MHSCRAVCAAIILLLFGVQPIVADGFPEELARLRRAATEAPEVGLALGVIYETASASRKITLRP